MLIGLDVGGTHTDAVLLHAATGMPIASVKAETRPGDIAFGILAALRELMTGARPLSGSCGNDASPVPSPSSRPPTPALAVAAVDPAAVRRVCVSSTLGLNALLTGNAEPTGMLAVPGPGIDPRLFWGEDVHFHVLAGAQDHRGQIIAPPDSATVEKALHALRSGNIRALGIVSKFSPKNPELENDLAAAARRVLGPEAVIVSGAEVSGALNFPRRLHTAWCNAALGRISRSFIAALHEATRALGLTCPLVVLKADAGVFSAAEAARDPAGTMGSGPAASLLGVWALSRKPQTPSLAPAPGHHSKAEAAPRPPLVQGAPTIAPDNDMVMVDMGGTTTDLALLAAGEPLLAPRGLTAAGRPTLVRALWTRSIALGGDSSLHVGEAGLAVGPERLGPALSLASGGAPTRPPTLTDALNILGLCAVGNVALSHTALEAIWHAAPPAVKHTFPSACDLARAFAQHALARIRTEMESLLAEVNAQPVYTIRELLVENTLQPQEAVFIGGPAAALAHMAEACWGLPVRVPAESACANAIGAALARPTRSAELYADTLLGRMTIPALGIAKTVDRTYTAEKAKAELLQALAAGEHTAQTPSGLPGPGDVPEPARTVGAGLGTAQHCGQGTAQIVFAENFLMLDDSGRRGRVLRMRAQLPAGLLM